MDRMPVKGSPMDDAPQLESSLDSHWAPCPMDSAPQAKSYYEEEYFKDREYVSTISKKQLERLAAAFGNKFKVKMPVQEEEEDIRTILRDAKLEQAFRGKPNPAAVQKAKEPDPQPETEDAPSEPSVIGSAIKDADANPAPECRMLDLLDGDPIGAEGTLAWWRSRYAAAPSPKKEKAPVAERLDLYRKDAEFLKAWTVKNGNTYFPITSANVLSCRNFFWWGRSEALFCLDLFGDLDFLKEELSIQLDGSRRRKSVSNLFIRSFLASAVAVSCTAYSLAMSNWDGSQNVPFELGNCLPRSILFPFTGEEVSDKHNRIESSVLPKDYNSVSLNTSNFVKSSERRSQEDRWSSGCFIADYITVSSVRWNRSIKKISGSGSGSKMSRVWVPVPNEYLATDKMKALVAKIRSGDARFAYIDCKCIAEWFCTEYINLDSGESFGSAKQSAKDRYPELWEDWTGVRTAGSHGQPERLFANFADAMNECSEEIADGRLHYVSRVEKLIRGMFLGEGEGRSIDELTEDRSTESLVSSFGHSMPVFEWSGWSPEYPEYRGSLWEDIAPSLPKEEDILEMPVIIDVEALKSILNSGSELSALNPSQVDELVRLAEESEADQSGKTAKSVLKFKRTIHGRFYGFGNGVQSLSKDIRSRVFPGYDYVDLDCGNFSVLYWQLKNANYKGDLTEIETMVADRKAYRESLVDESLGIGIEDVKLLLTMIGFGCSMRLDEMKLSAEFQEICEICSHEPDPYEFFRYCRRNALFTGRSTADELKSITAWASQDRVRKLWSEVREGGSFLIAKNTIRTADGKTGTVNAWGTVMKSDRQSRATFGQKMAHLYQGAESKILWEICHGIVLPDGQTAYEAGLVGPVIHDGLYLHKSLRDLVGDPVQTVERIVREKFGWNLKYSLE